MSPGLTGHRKIIQNAETFSEKKVSRTKSGTTANFPKQTLDFALDSK